MEWTSWDDRDRSSFCRWLRRIHLFWTADLLFVRLLDIKKKTCSKCHVVDFRGGVACHHGVFCCCVVVLFFAVAAASSSRQIWRRKTLTGPFGCRILSTEWNSFSILMQPVFRLVTLWIPCGWQLNITENQLLECINHETMQLNGPSNNHSYITIYKRVGVNLLTWLHWNWALATEVAGLRHVETILYWGFTVINHPQQQYDIYIIHTHIYIHTLFRLHINRYLIVFILCIYIYTYYQPFGGII